jgi:hypothetical protein
MAGNNLAKLGDPRLKIMDIDHMMFCLVLGASFGWVKASQCIQMPEKPFGWENILSQMPNFMLLLRPGDIRIKSIGQSPSEMVDGKRGKLKTGVLKEVDRDNI